jgi:NADPH:quinone reductase-like Zn-dependent oxidoreductase
MEMVKTLGVDKVIDYTREDFTKNGEIYDVIFVTVDKISFPQRVKSLHKRGILILGATGIWGMLQGVWTSMTSTQQVMMGVIREKAQDMILLKELIEAGQMKPVIDRTYRLGQMAAAHEYVEKGHKKGNMVITLYEDKYD